ncbi:MAG: hypothetical protein JW727_03915 [Candidatus Aenigmarchaeota archaeon]|nr:hypothetical protein [Candidatus Aenigmarchaeota archaeon]
MDSIRPSSVEVAGAMLIAVVAYFLLSGFIQNGNLASVLGALIALFVYILYKYFRRESNGLVTLYADRQNRIFLALVVIFVVADVVLNNTIPYVVTVIAAAVLTKIIVYKEPKTHKLKK